MSHSETKRMGSTDINKRISYITDSMLAAPINKKA